MAAELKALIDLNVILDVLQRREPFYDMAARVLTVVFSNVHRIGRGFVWAFGWLSWVWERCEDLSCGRLPFHIWSS
jgi:hypothetical protein